MEFRYDFDMFSVIPDEVGQEIQDMFADVGIEISAGDQVALFRDPALADALKNAEDAVQKLFLKAGFGLHVYESGAPAGRYPEYDEAARNACLRNLADGIAESNGLNNAEWGGFSIDDFMDYLANAEPVDLTELKPKRSGQIMPRLPKPYVRLGLVAGGAIAAVSTVTMALGAFGP